MAHDYALLHVGLRHKEITPQTYGQRKFQNFAAATEAGGNDTMSKDWYQADYDLKEGIHGAVDGGLPFEVVPMAVLQNIAPCHVSVILTVLGYVHPVLALCSISRKWIFKSTTSYSYRSIGQLVHTQTQHNAHKSWPNEPHSKLHPRQTHFMMIVMIMSSSVMLVFVIQRAERC